MIESAQPPAPAGAKTVPASAITPAEVPIPTAPATPPEKPASEPPPVAAIDPNAERDSADVPFDSARHLPKKHPHTGRWMPKGGRKVGPSSAATSSASSHGETSKPSAPAPASFIPATPPPPPAESAESDAPGSSRAPDARAEVVDHSDDAGEVACQVAQFTAGVLLDAPEDVAPSAAEHRHMVKATAAYIRSKGWQATAGIGLALMFAAWLLKTLRKPRPMAKVHGWLHLDDAAAKPAENSKPGASSTTPAAPAQPPGLPPGVPPLAS